MDSMFSGFTTAFESDFVVGDSGEGYIFEQPQTPPKDLFTGLFEEEPEPEPVSPVSENPTQELEMPAPEAAEASTGFSAGVSAGQMVPLQLPTNSGINYTTEKEIKDVEMEDAEPEENLARASEAEDATNGEFQLPQLSTGEMTLESTIPRTFDFDFSSMSMDEVSQFILESGLLTQEEEPTEQNPVYNVPDNFGYSATVYGQEAQQTFMMEATNVPETSTATGKAMASNSTLSSISPLNTGESDVEELVWRRLSMEMSSSTEHVHRAPETPCVAHCRHELEHTIGEADIGVRQRVYKQQGCQTDDQFYSQNPFLPRFFRVVDHVTEDACRYCPRLPNGELAFFKRNQNNYNHHMRLFHGILANNSLIPEPQSFELGHANCKVTCSCGKVLKGKLGSSKAMFTSYFRHFKEAAGAPGVCRCAVVNVD